MIMHYQYSIQNPLTDIGVKHDETIENNFLGGKSTNNLSVLKMLEQVMVQVEYHCFTDLRLNRIDPFYRELCLIISEVLVMNHGSSIKVNGSFVSVYLVQEVYSKLCNDHIRLVYNNFHKVSHRIFNKKAYLRTALYNAVFEIESHFVNEKACDSLTD